MVELNDIDIHQQNELFVDQNFKPISRIKFQQKYGMNDSVGHTDFVDGLIDIEDETYIQKFKNIRVHDILMKSTMINVKVHRSKLNEFIKGSIQSRVGKFKL